MPVFKIGPRKTGWTVYLFCYSANIYQVLTIFQACCLYSKVGEGRQKGGYNRVRSIKTRGNMECYGRTEGELAQPACWLRAQLAEGLSPAESSREEVVISQGDGVGGRLGT